MFDEAIRPIKDKVLIPFSQIIGRKLSPNFVTLVSFIFGLGSITFIFGGSVKTALVFWVLNRITDGLDGTVARVTNRQTDFGGYIDIMADFVIYSCIPISFVIYRGSITNELLFLSLMLASFYINAASWMYLSSILEKKGKGSDKKMTSVIMPSGLVEGFETVILYTLFYIFTEKILLLFIIMGLTTIIGAFQRVIWAYRTLK